MWLAAAISPTHWRAASRARRSGVCGHNFACFAQTKSPYQNGYLTLKLYLRQLPGQYTCPSPAPFSPTPIRLTNQKYCPLFVAPRMPDSIPFRRLSSPGLLLHLCACLLLAVIINTKLTYQQDSLAIKTEPFYIDLYHRFDSSQDFTPRGSILVRPRTEHRAAQASFVQQNDLTESDVKVLEKSSQQGDTYYLRAALRKKKTNKGEQALKTTQTILKSCSLYVSNLTDFLTINLSPLNDFISVNLYTTNVECDGEAPSELSTRFNSTVLIDAGSIGPKPDTVTYIKRLEEERQNKLKEGKEDNRSFFAKYWIYIVPAVIMLMMLSGPEQGAR